MALQAGLSAGIINPNAKAMMQSYDTYMVLSGNDSQCTKYIEKYAVAPETAETKPKTTANFSLSDCIVKGLKENAYTETVELLKTKAPMDIINGDLVPALDIVGKGFEKGTMFLPQLLMSAEAAKAGFEAIKEYMKKAEALKKRKQQLLLQPLRVTSMTSEKIS